MAVFLSYRKREWGFQPRPRGGLGGSKGGYFSGPPAAPERGYFLDLKNQNQYYSSTTPIGGLKFFFAKIPKKLKLPKNTHIAPGNRAGTP